eukprot:1145378-Pelagomonas_calceolata.AAC.9
MSRVCVEELAGKQTWRRNEQSVDTWKAWAGGPGRNFDRRASCLQHPGTCLVHLCEQALIQNEITDIFRDDFNALSEEDGMSGNRKESIISEYQSFTHLTYSKNKGALSRSVHVGAPALVSRGQAVSVSHQTIKSKGVHLGRLATRLGVGEEG